MEKDYQNQPKKKLKKELIEQNQLHKQLRNQKKFEENQMQEGKPFYYTYCFFVKCNTFDSIT